MAEKSGGELQQDRPPLGKPPAFPTATAKCGVCTSVYLIERLPSSSAYEITGKHVLFVKGARRVCSGACIMQGLFWLVFVPGISPSVVGSRSATLRTSVPAVS